MNDGGTDLSAAYLVKPREHWPGIQFQKDQLPGVRIGFEIGDRRRQNPCPAVTLISAAWPGAEITTSKKVPALTRIFTCRFRNSGIYERRKKITGLGPND
jgi:hypothetical protein